MSTSNNEEDDLEDTSDLEGMDDDWNDASVCEETECEMLSTANTTAILPNARSLHTKRCIQQDVDELRLIHPFVALDPWFTKYNHLVVRLAIPVSDLNLNIEQCLAWWLQPESFIVVELLWKEGSEYLLRDAKVSVGQISTLAALIDPLQSFKLAWTLNSRLTKWLSQTSTTPSRAYDLDSVWQLMDMSECTFIYAIDTLCACKNDLSEAASKIINQPQPPPYTKNALLERLSVHNALVQVMRFVRQTMRTCHSQCMLCDTPLPFPGLKPAICDHARCKFGFEEFSLAFDLGMEIRGQPMVVDLLISCTMIAAQDKRLHFVTPVDVSVFSEGKELNFKLANGQLDQDKVVATLHKCPSVPELHKYATNGDLLSQLQALDVLLVPLLRWILISNRAHLRLLTDKERIPEIQTPYQFVMLSNTPEAEARFQQLKRQTEMKKPQGSFYAFHGSPTGNWHSILRVGLKNMSNTQYQKHGAAYGSGVYMADNSHDSLAYCGQTRGWERSQMSAHFNCLALCEVINDVKDPFPYYVVPEEEKITTRYLFVLPASNGGFASVKAMSLQSSLPKCVTSCSMWDGITINQLTRILIIGPRGTGRTTLLNFLIVKYEDELPPMIVDDYQSGKREGAMNLKQQSAEGFILCTQQLCDIPVYARRSLNYIFYTGAKHKSDRDLVWKLLHESSTFQHLGNMRFHELCAEMTTDRGIVAIQMETGNITRVQVQ